MYRKIAKELFPDENNAIFEIVLLEKVSDAEDSKMSVSDLPEACMWASNGATGKRELFYFQLKLCGVIDRKEVSDSWVCDDLFDRARGMINRAKSTDSWRISAPRSQIPNNNEYGPEDEVVEVRDAYPLTKLYSIEDLAKVKLSAEYHCKIFGKTNHPAGCRIELPLENGLFLCATTKKDSKFYFRELGFEEDLIGTLQLGAEIFYFTVTHPFVSVKKQLEGNGIRTLIAARVVEEFPFFDMRGIDAINAVRLA